MAETINNGSKLNFFKKLKKNNDTAIIRILHSTYATYEQAGTHRYPVNGKTKCLKCIGENCPLCKRGEKREDSFYIHLWDYGEPQGEQECVWTRYKIDKDLPQLDTIIQNWGSLDRPVIRVTRVGDNYPTYNFEVVENSETYAPVSPDLINASVAYRCMTTRNADELETLINTGVLPDHQKNTNFIPREQYNQMNAQQRQDFRNGGNYGTYSNAPQPRPAQNYNNQNNGYAQNNYRQNNYPQNNGYGQGSNYGQNNYQQNGNNTPNPNLNPLPNNTDAPF